MGVEVLVFCLEGLSAGGMPPGNLAHARRTICRRRARANRLERLDGPVSGPVLESLRLVGLRELNSEAENLVLRNGEVNNGGFDQFFFNSAGDDAARCGLSFTGLGHRR